MNLRTQCAVLVVAVSLAALLGSRPLHAQELPYFITYSHHMEEPGSLDIESKNALGTPGAGPGFWGDSVEFEYGTRGWWTSELYLDMQHAADQGSSFAGFRIENRFRPLLSEHRVNPVFYVEFEDINGADKSVLEVVGHDGKADLAINAAEAAKEKQREVELKLILSSNAKGWNFSENIIGEKDLNNSPWEFGYALAASRPLRQAASARSCPWCAENFQAGLEMYGGLGDRYTPGTRLTSQYLGPLVNWTSPHNLTLGFSTSFGLNDYSVDRLYRIGVSYELGQVAQWFRRERTQ